MNKLLSALLSISAPISLAASLSSAHAQEQWANGNPASGSFGDPSEGHWGDPSEGTFGNLYSKEHMGRMRDRERRLARYNSNKQARQPYIVLDRPVETRPDSSSVSLEATGEAVPDSYEIGGDTP